MLQAHQLLGDFEIIRLLGKGGMGEVYEAQQLHPPRRVALKVLAPWLADSEEALERFERESAVPAQLDHPGIVRIISTGRTDDGLAYYTMQLVQGISLAHLLREAAHTPLPLTVMQPTTTDDSRHCQGEDPSPPEPAAGDILPDLIREYRAERFRVAARLGVQAARALAAAHRQDVLHRDVKPSNLMIDRHRQLYVVDFGLTKALAPDATGTRTGVVRGTPWYMSAEQARGEPLDARSDLFSLGVTLYELATGGQGPYAASRAESEAVLRDVRAGKVLPVGTFAADVPPGLERVLQRALAHKPRQRYQVAEEMVADLECVEQELGPRTRTMRRQGGVRRWRGVLPSLALVAPLAALAALCWWLAGRMPGLSRPQVPPAEEAVADPLPPLPADLRDRRSRHAVNLLQTDFEPLWSYTLFGKGRASPLPQFGLALHSPPGEPMTLVALDNPGRQWFDYAIEMQGVPAAAAAAQGLFFGYRRRPGSVNPAGRFFLLRIQELAPGAKAPASMQLLLAFLGSDPGQKPTMLSVADLPGGEGYVPLRPRGPKGWRSLRVRATEETITIKADSESLAVDLRRLKRDLEGGGEDLDPRGLLGIWDSEGAAFFQNASVTVAAPEP
jgi:hypothetical protein